MLDDAVTLHPTPRGRDVVLEQIRIAGLDVFAAWRWSPPWPSASSASSSRARRSWECGDWFDSDDWFATSVASFLFPFAVWRREKRFGPAFLWTLPVDRRRLALAKVFAGWVWLIDALAVFVVWLLRSARLSGVDGPHGRPLLVARSVHRRDGDVPPRQCAGVRPAPPAALAARNRRCVFPAGHPQ